MKVGLYYFHLLALGVDPGRKRTVDEFVESAWRFSITYRKFPAGCDHELVVVFLRGDPTPADLAIWSGVPCRFEQYHPKETDGWSMQALQEQVENSDYDFTVTTVSRAYFHRPGWLKRMVDTRNEFGDGLYGSMASDQGCPLQTHPAPNPHLRGSMFAFDTKTFAQYPHKILSPADEYRFECGDWNVSSWYESIGKPVRMVTFDGSYAKPDWFTQVNTFCKGDQSNLLNWDRHTDAYRDQRPLE